VDDPPCVWCRPTAHGRPALSTGTSVAASSLITAPKRASLTAAVTLSQASLSINTVQVLKQNRGRYVSAQVMSSESCIVRCLRQLKPCQFGASIPTLCLGSRHVHDSATPSTLLLGVFSVTSLMTGPPRSSQARIRPDLQDGQPYCRPP
jgi:hypothetical protein